MTTIRRFMNDINERGVKIDAVKAREHYEEAVPVYDELHPLYTEAKRVLKHTGEKMYSKEDFTELCSKYYRAKTTRNIFKYIFDNDNSRKVKRIVYPSWQFSEKVRRIVSRRPNIQGVRKDLRDIVIPFQRNHDTIVEIDVVGMHLQLMRKFIHSESLQDILSQDDPYQYISEYTGYPRDVVKIGVLVLLNGGDNRAIRGALKLPRCKFIQPFFEMVPEFKEYYDFHRVNKEEMTRKIFREETRYMYSKIVEIHGLLSRQNKGMILFPVHDCLVFSTTSAQVDFYKNTISRLFEYSTKVKVGSNWKDMEVVT